MTTTRPDDLQLAAAGPRPETGRGATPAIAPEEFRRIGHALVDRVAGLLAEIPSGPVVRHRPPAAVRDALDAGAPLPRTGSDPAELLASTADLLVEHSLLNGHPRFFGYITAAPAPIGILGDLLAAAVNANLGAWKLSPMASEIEAQTVRWVAELLDYPTSCGGLMVSGGNMANIVALIAARARATSGAVRSVGVSGAGRPMRVYASMETHTWIKKAVDIAGIGTESIRWIATDDGQRMRIDALRDAIDADLAAGELPMMVIGTSGTVSTGAIDPLPAIAALCREHGIWFHVDGAYGGFAAALPDTAEEFRAIADADSIAVDPHKWLYAPLEAGCVLVRDPAALHDAFSYSAAYYNFEGETTNYYDLGPQNSRGFRALKVWLALRQLGRDGYVESIADDIRLSRRMHQQVAAHPALEALTQSLSISTFRYLPDDLRERIGHPGIDEYLDRLNHEILDRVERSGEAFMSNAIVGGRYALRACIVNFNTTAADVDAIPEIVARHGREADEALRGGAAVG